MKHIIKLYCTTIVILIVLFPKVICSQDFVELLQSSSISDISSNHSAFADIDGDGDLDLGLVGVGNGIGRVSKLYLNDGTGMFFELENTTLDPVNKGAIAFSDVDNDGDQDVLITGKNNQEERIAKLYINDGSGKFIESLETGFHGVLASDISFEDIDNDGDMDVLIVGTLIPFEGISAKLYLNNGDGVFSEFPNSVFEPVRNGSIDFADVNNDGFQDVLITGENTNFKEVSNLYINNDGADFTLVSNPFKGVSVGGVKFGDFDGDNDEDVIITGFNKDHKPSTNLYFNNGKGVFTKAFNGSSFTPVGFSAVDVADVDNDNDIDILISGRSSNETITKLYINDGAGVFTEHLEVSLMNVSSGEINFADLDNDGDQDLLVSGPVSTPNGVETKTKIYMNGLIASLSNKVKDENFIEVFPNPTFNNRLFISLSDHVTGYVSISLYDMSGRMMFNCQEYINTANRLVEINPKLAPSIYMLELRTDTGVISKKVVLK